MKNAIITGSTSGIGLAMAQALAQDGYNIVLNGLGDANAIEKTRQTIENLGKTQIFYHHANMTKPNEISDMVQFAMQKLGRVDLLINNAGVQHINRVEEFPHEKWDFVLAINLSAAFHAIKACLPAMQAQNYGRIVNVASVHGLVASPDKAAYIAAKHGLVGLTKAVALENATYNITCNAICPGVVMTDLVQKQVEQRAQTQNISFAEALEDMFLKKQPSKRAVEASHLGEAIKVFLGPAGSSINGTTLAVDGGWTAQ